MDVGELLREARARAGLSQRRLAERAATSQPAVASWESGHVSPTVQTLDRLLAACGLQARVRLEPLLADSLSAAGVSWAVDGGCALRLQGLGAAVNLPEIVFCFDEAGRRWLFRNGVRGSTRRGPMYASWSGVELPLAQEALADETFGMLVGRLVARPVAVLPATVELSVGWCDRAVPVVTVDAVEQAHPRHAEVLARLRQRRSLTA